MEKHRTLLLACFTPLATLATFAIEYALAAFVFLRYGHRPFGRLVSVFLLLLGTFQLAEYQICLGDRVELWTVIGWVAITVLPSASVHIAAWVTRRTTLLVPIFHAIAAAFVGIMLWQPEVVQLGSCTGKFVTFSYLTTFGEAYAAYYMAGLVLALVFLVTALLAKTGNRSLVGWTLAGYCAFLVPTGVLTMFAMITRMNVPSILCGFAILLAIILATRVVPLEARMRQTASANRRVRSPHALHTS
ncbi:hypothetical protein HY632_04840 [Candidatus Uhrbacteria bacterium]|nr:hypothetical protein [Candidatus Uhrbacteria bacterium]